MTQKSYKNRHIIVHTYFGSDGRFHHFEALMLKATSPNRRVLALVVDDANAIHVLEVGHFKNRVGAHYWIYPDEVRHSDHPRTSRGG